MLFRSTSAFICLFIFIASCNTTKKTKSDSAITTIQLDTIRVLPGKDSKELYRASNTRQNDILHTKLEVSFDWKLCRMNGKATLLVKPYFEPVNVLYLNARGMDILKVQLLNSNKELINTTDFDQSDASAGIEKTPGSYTYKNDSLQINLGRFFGPDERYYVLIDYVAKPNELKQSGGSSAITDDKGLYFVNPQGENPLKMPQIWTQGETQASSVWFPTIDSPNERMTQEIFMRVDDKYITLSNGVLASSVKQDDGTRIDHWKLEEPHAPYLAMMAVGEFKKVIDTPWNGKEISYYVEPLYEEHAKAIFGDTREMIEFYSSVLGVPYVWPKYAQIVARDYVSGAMENTSATLHGDFMVYQTSRETRDYKKGDAVIAHELFHQWFGDLVTCESWSNLSLNESFATYGEYLWEEYKYGRDVADYRHWQSKQGYLNANKEVEIIRFHYKDKEDMFDAFSYNKGGQILHMLRKTVGDKAFFASLKNYLETNKFKPVEIHNLRLAFEETTGRDLNWFFNQWFMSKGRPSLSISKTLNAAKDTLILTIKQTQDLQKYPLYTLPLEVDIYAKGQVYRKHIEVTGQEQTFVFRTEEAPGLVNVDAERQLLADFDYVKSDEEYIFQYKNAPLFEDRWEALGALKAKMAKEDVFNLFLLAAETDKLPAIREYAIQQLEKITTEKKDAVKALLMRQFLREKNNMTRAKIISAISTVSGKEDNMTSFYLTSLSDSSYVVCAEALTAVAKANPSLAMQKAPNLERETGKELLFAMANLYAANGGDGQVHFFHNSLKYINGFDMIGFTAYYVKTARKCSIRENVLLAATDLEMISKGANKYVKFSALKGIKDLLSTWESKEATARVAIDAAKKENKSSGAAEQDLNAATAIKTKIAEIYERAKL